MLLPPVLLRRRNNSQLLGTRIIMETLATQPVAKPLQMLGVERG